MREKVEGGGEIVALQKFARPQSYEIRALELSQVGMAQFRFAIHDRAPLSGSTALVKVCQTALELECEKRSRKR